MKNMSEAIKEEAEGVEAGIEVLWANLADKLSEKDIELLRKMEKRLESIKWLAERL